MRRDFSLRAVIFANGDLEFPQAIQEMIRERDLIVAADGGTHHCLELGLTPDIIIGDFDSLEEEILTRLEKQGVEIIRHPTQKDHNDLELALRLVLERGFDEALVLAALGSRWDQTLANVLLPATASLDGLRVHVVDGPQEILLLKAGNKLQIAGATGDTLSLIPLGGDAQGITTQGLEYPLNKGTLKFGSSRGISNVMLDSEASISLDQGLLLCVVIHQNRRAIH
jgi:thiamine pyrophosphokinase